MIGQVAANIRQKNTAASDRLAAVNARLDVSYSRCSIIKTLHLESV